MGIEKIVDKLGRIVLPIEYRQQLGINTDDKVIVSLVDNKISISPIKRVCALCGAEILNTEGVRVCEACTKIIKET